MKTHLLASLVTITALFVGSPLFAQNNDKSTKVAVVNLTYVYENYDRVKAYKSEVTGTLEPYKKISKLYQDYLPRIGSVAVVTPGSDPNFMRKHRSELEKLKIETDRLIEEKYKDRKATLTKEVNTGIELVAKAYGFQIVLGHGGPNFTAGDVFIQMAKEKATPSDNTGLTPIYVDGNVDISNAVVTQLNQWAKQASQPQQK